jgi:hypothetical protein
MILQPANLKTRDVSRTFGVFGFVTKGLGANGHGANMKEFAAHGLENRCYRFHE